MKTIEIISQDIFDKIRSRFVNLQMGDETGNVTMDPRQARFYDFDFVIESKNLGRVSISINELGTLKVFYSKGLLEDSDPLVRDYWYSFLKEMRMFAMRRLLRFDTRDISKSNLDKNDFQYLASKGSKEETMNIQESAKFSGGKQTSYRMLERTKLILKHKKSIHDESYGARSRRSNIKAIFIENELGERFKFPINNISAAEAMQRHVANGGRPHDEKGQAIIGMAEEIAQLTGFKRHLGETDGMNQQVNEIAVRVAERLEQLKNSVHSLKGQNGYEAWSESFVPQMAEQTELDDATLEDYKSKFSVTKFKEDLAQYFPIIHRIMKETNTVDLEEYVNEGEGQYTVGCSQCGGEFKRDTKDGFSHCRDHAGKKNLDVDEAVDDFKKFESWADSITEGTLEPDALMNLKDLLDENPEMKLGVDGTVGIAALEGIGIVSDTLADLITAKSKLQDGENTLLRDAVAEWLVKDDPEAARDLELMPKQTVAQPQMQQQPAMQQPQMQPASTTEGEKETGRAKHKPTLKELAQWLQGFYNPNFQEQGFESPWRKGVTELSSMAENEFGGHYGKMIEQMISKLTETPLQRISREGGMRNAREMDETHHDEISVLTRVDNPKLPKGPEEEQFETILKLAGIKKDETINPDNPRDYERPAIHRKQAGEPPLNLKDIEDRESESPTTAAGLAKKKAALGMTETDKPGMSRAAKGHEKYGKEGMKALAKAGQDGASEKKMDAIRSRYDRYNENADMSSILRLAGLVK